MRYRQNTKGDILYGPPVILKISCDTIFSQGDIYIYGHAQRYSTLTLFMWLQPYIKTE